MIKTRATDGDTNRVCRAYTPARHTGMRQAYRGLRAGSVDTKFVAKCVAFKHFRVVSASGVRSLARFDVALLAAHC